MLDWLRSLFDETPAVVVERPWVTREMAVIDAMMLLTRWVLPTAPPEVMEAATKAAFAKVPGYSASYHDCVCIDGSWRDLVIGFQSPGAQWNPDVFGKTHPMAG